MYIRCCVAGQSVLAMWTDKHYYPATVLSLDNKKIQVRFNGDGHEAWLKSTSLTHCDLVPVGLPVLACIESEWSEPATVISYYTDSTSDVPTGYNVQLNNSDPIVRYCLSEAGFYRLLNCKDNSWIMLKV